MFFFLRFWTYLFLWYIFNPKINSMSRFLFSGPWVSKIARQTLDVLLFSAFAQIFLLPDYIQRGNSKSADEDYMSIFWPANIKNSRREHRMLSFFQMRTHISSFLISSTWTLRCQMICPTSVFWPLGVQNKTRVTQHVPFSWSRARKPALWRWLKTFNMNLRLFPDLWVSKIAKDKEHVLVSLPLGTYVGSLYIFSSKTYQKGS